MTRPSPSSLVSELQKNSDGLIDLYFGSKAMDGKDNNWIPTDPTRKFELMFRAYGPKSWVLPDVEKLP